MVPLLLVASYVFYMSWRPIYGVLILGLTAANFIMANCIAKSEKHKKLWLAATVAVNLITLAIFKYSNFGLSSVKGGLHLAGIDWREPHLHIILPLGISFFVFEFIHYAAEIFKGKPLVKSFPQFAPFCLILPHSDSRTY